MINLHASLIHYVFWPYGDAVQNINYMLY